MKNRIEFEKLSGGKGVLYCCEQLHGMCTGAIDINPAKFDQYLQALQFVVKNWDGRNARSYDVVVLALVNEAIIDATIQIEVGL